MILGRLTTIQRTAASVLTLAAVVAALAGCVMREPDAGASRRTEPPVDAETAKRQMIDAVDDATARLGGDWKPRTGPDAPEDCVLASGERGAQWRYLTGSTITGSPEDDAAEMADHWRAQGMHIIERDSSDGPAIFGSGGGKVKAMSVYAYSGNYTVQAVSLCFPGDADEMSERNADEDAQP